MMKFLIWFGCIVVASVVKVSLGYVVSLGGLPTLLLYGAAISCAGVLSRAYSRRRDGETETEAWEPSARKTAGSEAVAPAQEAVHSGEVPAAQEETGSREVPAAQEEPGSREVPAAQEELDEEKAAAVQKTLDAEKAAAVQEESGFRVVTAEQKEPNAEEVTPVREEPGSREATAGADARFCRSCGERLLRGSEFCSYCGTEVRSQGAVRLCPDCGRPVPEDSTFCPGCARRLAAPAAALEQAQAPVQPEDGRAQSPAPEAVTRVGARIRACKSCGAVVDRGTGICTGCGKRHLRLRTALPVAVLAALLLASGAWNLWQVFAAREADRTAAALETELAGLETERAELQERADSLGVTISTQNDTILTQSEQIRALTGKAEDYDRLCAALETKNLGYASENFHASEGILVVGEQEQGRSFTLTAYWEDGGRVSEYYDGYHALIEFESNSWDRTTEIKVRPVEAGVTVVTFRNSETTETFQVVIIVTD